MKENSHTISPTQILYPVILLCVTFMLLMAFQMSQILRDRTSLNDMRAQQEKGIEDSQRIQAQLVALIVGTQKLATEGDEHAQKIVEKLKTIGVIPQPQAQPLPPQSTMQQPGPQGKMAPIGAPTAPQAQPPMAVPNVAGQPGAQAPQAPAGGIVEPVAPAPVPVAPPAPGPVKP